MGADKIQFYPLDITYKIIDGKPQIYLFGRTIDNKQITVIDENFHPYFYVFLKDEDEADDFKRKITQIKVEHQDREAAVANAEIVDKRYLGKLKRVVKVYVKIPPDVSVIRDVIKEWEMIDAIHEYDIPFTRRYLIDKGITPLTTVEAEGEFVNLKHKTPVLKAEKIEQFSPDSIKKPKILAFDIETYNPTGKTFQPDKYPVIMLAFYGENFKKVITWKKFKTSEDYIEFVDGEVDLINKFKEVIEQYKPDILTGYFSDGFDFPYLITRAKKYNIDLDLGLDYSTIKFRKGKTETIQLTGIIHLDVFKFVRKVLGRSLDTESYSLNKVAAELLGEEKDQVDINNLADAWDNNKDLELFCKYNLQDSNLTFKLCQKILPNIEELVKIVGQPIYDINRMGFSQLVEWYILKQVQEFNEIAPNKPHYEEVHERRQQTYQGAFVYEPIPGLYKDIAVFDFRSLYPTIITSHNICLSTLNCSCCKNEAEFAPTDKKEYYFCKKMKGFLPIIIGDLISRRVRIKEIMKEKKDIMMEARSGSLKLLANAFYGYLGFFAARWYCIECSRSVTAYGRYYITKVIDEAKKAGFKVIYSDTDSVFLALEGKTEDNAVKFVEKINQDLPGIMELEYENFYPSGIFVAAKEGTYGAKKKYALLNKEGNLKITGFETVRRNWSFIAKEVQEKVLNIILKERDLPKAVKYVKRVILDLKNKKVPNTKLIINTQLKKDISEYTSIGPHVAVAKRLKEKGVEVGAGSIINFIVAEGPGIIRDKAKPTEETKEGEYDADYYVKHQIVPSVERIFDVLGYDKEELLVEKDQSKLGEYF